MSVTISSPLQPPPQKFSTATTPPTIFGVIDGINPVLTWAVTIQCGSVWRNGILQTLNIDVAVGQTAMVFLPGAIPQPGDIVTMLGFSSG